MVDTGLLSADVLLTYGTNGPPYYADLNNRLAEAIPNCRVLPIGGSGQDGINRAPRRLIEPLIAFLGTDHSRG